MKGVLGMLSVVVAEKPEDLLDELSGDLSVPLPDPFSSEWVSVPSLGMGNWAKKQLSLRLGAGHGHDGIVANIEFASPGSLRRRLIEAYRESIEGPNSADPWRIEALTWSVMEVLADSATEVDPVFAALDPSSARVARAAAIAKLFDGYNTRRPEMILNWLLGSDVDPDGRQLEAAKLWQPRLLRRVRAHIARTRGVEQTPAEAFRDVLLQLRAGARLGESGPNQIPARLFVFAQPTLTGDFGPMIQSLALGRDVKVLLLSPSPEATRRATRAVVDSAEVVRPEGASPTWAFQRSVVSSLRCHHPLFQTWGQLQYDSALLLGAGEIVPQVSTNRSSSGPSKLSTDQDHGSPGARTLLSVVQQGISEDRPGKFEGEFVRGDNSIRIHAASGATRQVEVLRDQILELLSQDPSLCEDEIVILCPRLDLYSPIITAVFGASDIRGTQPERGRVPTLRYTLVDQSAGTLNPLFGALSQLLELVPGRFTYSEVVSLLRSGAVQQRFDLVEDDLRVLDVLGKDARVRWGLDGEHRAAWRIDPSYAANSWAWGVDQLLMGVALGDDLRLAPLPGQTDPPTTNTGELTVGDIPPLTLAEGSIASAGRVAAAIASMHQVQELLCDGQDHTVQQWCHKVAVAADLMLQADRFQDWQRSALDRVLDSLTKDSADSGGSPSELHIAFEDFRRLISPVIEGSQARANLSHGTILVARPGVLASVPHKVVCILGLDADSLPTAVESVDDLGASSEWVGDQDARLTGRADLLSAVMSARQHLVVTCTGSDVRNNQPVPPAVVLEEFVETIADVLDVSPRGVREQSLGIFVTHPRQAFHPQNFDVAVGRSEPLSYDPIALEGALALQNGTHRPEAQQTLLDHRLDIGSGESELVDLAELLSFFEHPIKKFFTASLGVTLPDREERHDEELPTAISGLDAYSIGQALLDAGLVADILDDLETSTGTLSGDRPSGDRIGGLWRFLEAPIAAGVLPPPAIFERELPAIADEVRELLTLADEWDVRRVASSIHPIDLRLPSGARLVGSVDGCVEGHHPGPVDIRFTRAKPFHRIRQAIQLLVLAASDPSTEWRGVLITRGLRSGTKSGPRAFQSVRAVLGHDPTIRTEAALDALDVLVGQYRDGLSCPLPLFEKTSMAKWIGASISSQWGEASGPYARGEGIDKYHLRAFGPMQASDLTNLSIDGFTLDSEAKRLWGTIEGVIVDPAEVEQQS